MTEEQVRALQERFQAGEARALQQLVMPIIAQIRGVCLRWTGDETDAEDLVQDTIVRAIQHHAAYEPGRPLRPWLLTIARRLWLNRVRTPWHARRLDEYRSQADSVDPEIFTAAMQRETMVRTALRTLPPATREVLALFHLDGMTYAEIALITGASEPALRQRCRRGNGLLRKTLLDLFPDLRPAPSEARVALTVTHGDRSVAAELASMGDQGLTVNLREASPASWRPGLEVRLVVRLPAEPTLAARLAKRAGRRFEFDVLPESLAELDRMQSLLSP